MVNLADTLTTRVKKLMSNLFFMGKIYKKEAVKKYQEISERTVYAASPDGIIDDDT